MKTRKYTKETVDTFCSLTEEEILFGLDCCHDSKLMKQPESINNRGFCLVFDSAMFYLAMEWLDCNKDFLALKLCIEYK